MCKYHGASLWRPRREAHHSWSTTVYRCPYQLAPLWPWNRRMPHSNSCTSHHAKSFPCKTTPSSDHHSQSSPQIHSCWSVMGPVSLQLQSSLTCQTQRWASPRSNAGHVWRLLFHVLLQFPCFHTLDQCRNMQFSCCHICKHQVTCPHHSSTSIHYRTLARELRILGR